MIRLRSTVVVALTLVLLGAILVTTSAASPSQAGLAYMTGSLTRGPTWVWVAGANGAGRHRLGTGFSPVLSPNGRLVAVAPEAGSAVTVYSSSGRVLGRFFSSTRYQTHTFAWSPDSRYLAVALQSATGSHSGPCLVVIDTRTTRVRTIANGSVQGVSFAPNGADRVVYGLGKSGGDSSNLYTLGATGGQVKQLTHDGVSLNPVWGVRGIVFDRETPRTRYGLPSYPAYQLYLLAGSHLTRITHMSVGWEGEGLIPEAISADGTKLAANWIGDDVDQGWTVNIAARSVHELPPSFTADGISRDGRRVLLDSMFGLEFAPTTSKIETIPFAGGRLTMLVTPGGEASWDQ
ncbi:MAG TPA: hypothetical protein VEF89_16550 [Solirubrobacteraceae bacterium]|nr:hypothetical protein [Solirubrobacteraceae bacterium]